MFAILALACSFALSACSKAEETTESSTIETTQSTIEEPTTTFENGKLDTEDFTLEYKTAQIVKSPTMQDYGLYVTYELTNKTTENIEPSEILEECVLMQQESGTSLINIDDGYSSTDAFSTGEDDGEDIDRYNEQLEKESALNNGLLPSKTVEIVYSYGLDNLDNPVQLQMMVDPETEELSDIYLINLENLEKVPEPKQDTEDEEEIQEEENQEDAQAYSEEVSDMPTSWYGSVEEWEEAKSQGWTAEDYEAQVRASENESGPIQPGDPNYVDPSFYELSDEEQQAVDEADQFRQDFVNENGREPTSGEIQSAWLKEQGLE